MKILSKNTIIVLISVFLILYIFLWYTSTIPKSQIEKSPGVEFYSDLDQLYSNFTLYMRDTVDYRLQTVNCDPDKYYYDESDNLCFYCGEFDTCFGYGLVNRDGIKKMNPGGDITLVGDYSDEVSLSFSSFGVSRMFNCDCKEECVCDDGIKAELRDERVYFIFPENINVTEKIEKAALESDLKYEFKNNIFSCKYFDAPLVSNELIV